MGLRSSGGEKYMEDWRSLEPNEEVMVVSEGKYPRLDFKIGIATGKTRYSGHGTRNNLYEVYFPELDRSYWILLTYLTPMKGPTEAQKERYFQRARATLMKKTPEYKEKRKEVEKLSREAAELWREYQALPEEEKKRLHEEATYYPKDIKDLLASVSEEEELRTFDILKGLGYVEGVPWPIREEWEPYRFKAEEERKSREAFGTLEERLKMEFEGKEVEDYWSEV